MRYSEDTEYGMDTGTSLLVCNSYCRDEAMLGKIRGFRGALNLEVFSKYFQAFIIAKHFFRALSPLAPKDAHE